MPVSTAAGHAGPSQCPYLVVRDAAAVRDVLHRPDDFSPANALIAVTPLGGPALRVAPGGPFLFRLLEGTAPVPWADAASDSGSRAAVRHVLVNESSVPTWRRVAAHDTNLGGKTVPAGTEIFLE